MAKFEIGEIAIFYDLGHEKHLIEVEIISTEFYYNGGLGYDGVIANYPCHMKDSKNGEWFFYTTELRKKPKYDGYQKTKWRDCQWIPDQVLDDIPVLEDEH